MLTSETIQNTNSGQWIDLSFITIEPVSDSSRLTEKQEAFLQCFLNNSELRRNGTKSYAQAYGYDLDSYDRTNAQIDPVTDRVIRESDYDRVCGVCAAASSRMLRNVKIQERRLEILNEMLTEKVADGKLAEIITHGDYGESLGWIKEFNKLRGRITDKSEVQTDEATKRFYANLIAQNDAKMKEGKK